MHAVYILHITVNFFDRLINSANRLISKYKGNHGDHGDSMEYQEVSLEMWGLLNNGQFVITMMMASHFMFSFLKYFNQTIVGFNSALTDNSELRERIDHLRRERAIYDKLYKKLSKEQEDLKQQISMVIEESTAAYDTRYNVGLL